MAPGSRALANRVLLVVAVPIGLVAVVIAERLRPGWGRVVACAVTRALLSACGVTITTSGRDGLDTQTSYVFVANHSSPLDIPVILATVEDVRFLAAADLFRNPLLAAAMRALGTIPIDRRDPRIARRQLDAVAVRGAGAPLVVFAEGGIAPRGERLPFKSGAFALAIAMSAPVVPVAISGADDVLAPRARLCLRPGQVSVQFLHPVPSAGLGAPGRKALRSSVESAVLGALGRPATSA